MDKKSLLFLQQLRENSREKLTEISKKTKIPISTLFDLLQELQGKAITKNTILLNFPELGYHTRAQVFLKVAKEDKDKLKQHLFFHQNVNTLYKINNGWDFILETAHRNIKELDLFLDHLNEKFKLEDKQIHYVIDEVKREGFVLEMPN